MRNGYKAWSTVEPNPMTQLEKAREEIRAWGAMPEPYHWRQEALKKAMGLPYSDTLFVNIGNGVFLAWRWDSLSETLTYKGSSTNIADLVDLKPTYCHLTAPTRHFLQMGKG